MAQTVPMRRAGDSIRGAWKQLDAAAGGGNNVAVVPVTFYNGGAIIVQLRPDADSTIKCEYSVSDPALVAAGTARWKDSSMGTAAATAEQVFSHPVTAFRFTQVTGTGWFEVIA